jgi:hypothetical protein
MKQLILVVNNASRPDNAALVRLKALACFIGTNNSPLRAFNTAVPISYARSAHKKFYSILEGHHA